jgi:RNA polymerase sigma factor (TIGR02999 family)
MAEASVMTVTRLLQQLESGDRAALDQLFPLVYDELRLIAHGHRRRWVGDETIGTTVLVHEAYMKLTGHQPASGSRAHFLAVAGKAMRHILSNYARARRRRKRGGELQRLPFDALELLPAALEFDAGQAAAVDALDAALTRLEAANRRLSEVIECRFFGGMSIADTALVLGTSPATVKRDWILARAWLYREMQAHGEA